MQPGLEKPICNINKNTDFIVDQPTISFWFFLTANSSDADAKHSVGGIHEKPLWGLRLLAAEGQTKPV